MIPHKLIMQRLREKIADGWVLTSIEKRLKAGVMFATANLPWAREDGVCYKTTEGTPQGVNLKTVIGRLNPAIRGHVNYFRLGDVQMVYRRLDCWMPMRLRCFKFSRKWRTDNKRFPIRRFKKMGLLSFEQYFFNKLVNTHNIKYWCCIFSDSLVRYDPDPRFVPLVSFRMESHTDMNFLLFGKRLLKRLWPKLHSLTQKFQCP
jgi:hypothetical protein